MDVCRGQKTTVSLYIEKTLLETVTITFNFEVLDYGRFMKMITKVSKEIRKAFFGYRVYPFYNTNFSPTALMGILTQSIGVYFTENRPENIMKVLNLLQRTKGRPQCPGGINSLHESEEYFPGLGEHLQNNPHAMDLLTKKNLASVAVNTL